MRRNKKLHRFNWQKFEDIDAGADFIQLCLRCHCYGLDDEPDYPRYFRQYCLNFFCNQTAAGSSRLIKPFLHNSKPLTTIFKYLFTIDRMVSHLTSVDRLPTGDYPFLSEACRDLEFTIKLYGQGFIKQSFQTMRTALEEVVMHAYLCTGNWTDPKSLLAAKPFLFGGEKGMVEYLCDVQFIGKKESRKAVKLYRDLSATTHSRIDVIGHGFYSDSEYFIPPVLTFQNWIGKFESVCWLILNLIFRMRN